MADNEKFTVSRVIDASAKEIFEFLTLPRNHVAMDGSDMLRNAEQGDQRLQQVGEVFTIDMYREAKGEYQMDNHVSGLVENKLVAWKPAPAGTEPGGWQWVYELEAQGADQTEVTLTYDWSQVTDPKLKQIFPMVTEEQMEQSLAKLADAVAGA